MAEIVDLLQGRFPRRAFARHYLKVEDVKELHAQVLCTDSNLFANSFEKTD